MRPAIKTTKDVIGARCSLCGLGIIKARLYRPADNPEHGRIRCDRGDI